MQVDSQQNPEKVINHYWDSETLIGAIRRGNSNAVRDIISYENRVSNWNGGYDYLHEAMIHKQWDIVNILLDKVTKVNSNRVCGTHSALHCAVIENKYDIVKKLLQKGADIGVVDDHDMTVLHHAVILEHEAIVQILLEYGADTNLAKDAMFNFTPLQHACRARDERILKAFLDRGTDVNHTFCYPDTLICPRKSTLLHVVVIHGNLQSAMLLLDREADVNFANSGDETALHLACKDNNLRMVELLVDYGVQVDSLAKNKVTPFHIAVKNGYVEIVKYLLTKGADTKNKLMVAIEERHLEVLDCLLQHTRDPYDEGNRKAFQRALLKNGLRGEFFKRFLNCGFELTPDDVGHVAFEAVSIGYFHVIENLLEYAIQHSFLDLLLNVCNSDGDTLLISATKHRNHDIVRLLISKKAPVETYNNDCKQAIYYAIKNDDLQIVKTFLTQSENLERYPQLLYLIIDEKKEDSKQLLELMLQHGVNVNEQRNGMTPLHLVCEQSMKDDTDIDIAELLLRYNVNTHVKNSQGLTALHLAVCRKNLAMVQLLLKYNAEVEVRDNYGMTPLHHAASIPSYDNLSILLEAGSDINIIHYNDSTAVDVVFNLKQSLCPEPSVQPSEELQKQIQEVDKAYNVLVNHVIKLDVAGYHVTNTCRNHVTENYADFVKKCENELEIMKVDEINSYVTMYDVFTCTSANVRRFMKHTREETVKTDLKMIDLKGKYPIYGAILNRITDKVIMREYLTDKAKEAINLLTGYGLPDPCTEAICRNLYTNDLCNLLTAMPIHVAGCSL